MNTPKPKEFFMEKKYIISFAMRFLSIAFFAFVILGLILFLSLNKRLGVNYFQDISTLSSLQETLPAIILTTGIIQTVVLSFVLFLVSLFWAHKVAGPLVRFRRYLNMMDKGGIEEGMAFREEDQLHYLAQSFQLMQAARKIRQDRIMAQLRDAQRIVDEYEILSKEKGSHTPALKDKLSNLKKVYKNIQKLLQREDVV